MRKNRNRWVLPALAGGALSLLSLAACEADEGKAEAAVVTGELDFSGAEPGQEPEGLFVVDGEFVVAVDGDRRVLELKAEPLVEGLVLVGETVRGSGSVRAKVNASKQGRSYPRFGAGLHGISGYRMRVVPAQNSIEILKEDEVVARTDYGWEDGSWTWIALTVTVAADESARVDARAWLDGAEEPVDPLLTVTAKEGRFTGKGVLSGTPYSGTPIRYDRVAVSPHGG